MYSYKGISPEHSASSARTGQVQVRAITWQDRSESREGNKEKVFIHDTYLILYIQCLIETLN